jgi:hypothetical protein
MTILPVNEAGEVQPCEAHPDGAVEALPEAE